MAILMYLLQNSQYPFTGITICSDDDSNMIGSSRKSGGKTYFYYRCKQCSKMIRADKLHSKLFPIVAEIRKQNKELETDFNMRKIFKYIKVYDNIKFEIEFLKTQFEKIALRFLEV